MRKSLVSTVLVALISVSALADPRYNWDPDAPHGSIPLVGEKVYVAKNFVICRQLNDLEEARNMAAAQGVEAVRNSAREGALGGYLRRSDGGVLRVPPRCVATMVNGIFFTYAVNVAFDAFCVGPTPERFLAYNHRQFNPNIDCRSWAPREIWTNVSPFDKNGQATNSTGSP